MENVHKELTEKEEKVLKALIENAHTIGDTQKEFIIEDIINVIGLTFPSVKGVVSSLCKKRYIDSFNGESYFDGMIRQKAEEWYKQKP